MILNMNQLRAFHTAARLKSITRAAEALMVTPPAVTMQVKQLEETLDLRLLFREGNAIRLTDVGLEVYRRSRAVFAKLTEMENYLEDISTAKSGELKMGCPQTPARFIMPRIITRFKEMYPGIRIILDQGPNAEMVKSIIGHRNELAFVRHRPEERRLKIKVLGSEQVLLVAARKSRHLPLDEISVTRLSGIPLILPKKGSAMRDVALEYLQRYNVTPDVVMESASVGLMMEMIRRDSGVSFMERYAVEDDLKKGSIRSIGILEGSPAIQLGIGYLQRRYLSPAAWSFLRMLDKVEDILPHLG